MPSNGQKGAADPPSASGGHQARRNKVGEARLPPTIALLAAIALYALLPEALLLGPRFIVPSVEVLLLLAVVATNPRRITRQTRYSRLLSLLMAGLVVATNLLSLGLLIHELVSRQHAKGSALLLAALQVWGTNVIAFAVTYWELDRGGPVSRTQRPRDQLPLADFRWSQDETADNVEEVAAGSSIKADWIPTFIDYLYLSTTNSSAFSPTDTMPLTSRAKVLMGIQATAALLTSLLVIARAVSALS